jgi:hypothetical protein
MKKSRGMRLLQIYINVIITMGHFFTILLCVLAVGKLTVYFMYSTDTDPVEKWSMVGDMGDNWLLGKVDLVSDDDFQVHFGYLSVN